MSVTKEQTVTLCSSDTHSHVRASAERRRSHQARKEKDERPAKEEEQEEEEDNLTKPPQQVKKASSTSRLHRGLQGTPWRTNNKTGSPLRSVSTASPAILLKSEEHRSTPAAKKDKTCIMSLLEECDDDADSQKSGDSSSKGESH